MTQTKREQEYNPVAAQERSLRKLAREQFSVSCMNRTKWRELAEAFQGLITVGFRIKFINDKEIWELRWLISPSSYSYIEGGACGPMLYVAIEWLEISFVVGTNGTSDRDELRRRMRAQNIPFAEEADRFRIVGYSRDGGEARP